MSALWRTLTRRPTTEAAWSQAGVTGDNADATRLADPLARVPLAGDRDDAAAPTPLVARPSVPDVRRQVVERLRRGAASSRESGGDTASGAVAADADALSRARRDPSQMWGLLRSLRGGGSASPAAGDRFRNVARAAQDAAHGGPSAAEVVGHNGLTPAVEVAAGAFADAVPRVQRAWPDDLATADALREPRASHGSQLPALRSNMWNSTLRNLRDRTGGLWNNRRRNLTNAQRRWNLVRRAARSRRPGAAVRRALDQGLSGRGIREMDFAQPGEISEHAVFDHLGIGILKQAEEADDGRVGLEDMFEGAGEGAGEVLNTMPLGEFLSVPFALLSKLEGRRHFRAAQLHDAVASLSMDEEAFQVAESMRRGHRYRVVSSTLATIANAFAVSWGLMVAIPTLGASLPTAALIGGAVGAGAGAVATWAFDHLPARARDQRRHASRFGALTELVGDHGRPSPPRRLDVLRRTLLSRSGAAAVERRYGFSDEGGEMLRRNPTTKRGRSHRGEYQRDAFREIRRRMKTLDDLGANDRLIPADDPRIQHLLDSEPVKAFAAARDRYADAWYCLRRARRLGEPVGHQEAAAKVFHGARRALDRARTHRRICALDDASRALIDREYLDGRFALTRSESIDMMARIEDELSGDRAGWLSRLARRGWRGITRFFTRGERSAAGEQLEDLADEVANPPELRRVHSPAPPPDAAPTP